MDENQLQEELISRGVPANELDLILDMFDLPHPEEELDDQMGYQPRIQILKDAGLIEELILEIVVA